MIPYSRIFSGAFRVSTSVWLISLWRRVRSRTASRGLARIRWNERAKIGRPASAISDSLKFSEMSTVPKISIASVAWVIGTMPVVRACAMVVTSVQKRWVRSWFGMLRW